MRLWSGRLAPGEEELYASTLAAAVETLAPIAHAGTPGSVNRPLVMALAEVGLLDRLYGDGGVSAIELCLIREALARGCPDAESAFAVQGLGSYPILQAARPHVAEHWRSRLASGTALAAFALTEPDAGTDAAGIELAAERVGGGWVLSGVKTYISNAPDADVYTLFARTTPNAGSRGVTAFVVPADSQGLSGEPLSLMAPHPIGRLQLDGVHVPDDHVLGEVNRGFRVAMRTLDLFRPSVGACAVGMAEAALDVAVPHASAREAFGKPIRDFQAISQLIAEMATRTQAGRLLVHAAAKAFDGGADMVTLDAAMAKLYATEAASFVVDAAVQLLGARALEEGHVLADLYREVRSTRIYEGTSEIQREIIARQVFRKHDQTPIPGAP